MKRELFLLLFSSCYANCATYYVASASSTPAGNDANPGSVSQPFLTLGHAVNSVACGDTIMIVADTHYVQGDANLPYFANCSLITTVQSSLLSRFAPDGWRTIPAQTCPDPTDGVGPCDYGKLQLVAQGIEWHAEKHGSAASTYGTCEISNITGNTLTLFDASAGRCAASLPNLANRSQVEFQIDTVNGSGCGSICDSSQPPVGITVLQHYYVRSCSAGCGTGGSTLQLEDVAGNPITIGACSLPSCYLPALAISEPLQFTAGSPTITSPDTFTFTNGTPVALSSVGMQLFGSLPIGFLPDTPYYIKIIAGRNFQLSTDPAGLNIVTPSSVGFGPIAMANINVPHHWAFKGLELVEFPASFLGAYVLGDGNETSAIGTIHHIEIAHNWIHDNPGDTNGLARGIAENGRYVNIHDNWFDGIRRADLAESQAIGGWASAGPTWITDNFMESGTECTLYGGSGNYAGISNANKLFQFNFCYKPPSWKQSSNTGAPSVSVDPCWWDNTDPRHSGGEWYKNTASGQVYQCGSDFTWHTTTSPLPNPYTIKTMFESKSLRNSLYYGNLIKYNWAAAQSGQAFSTHMSYDSGPGMANDHIIIQNNKALNVFSAITQDSHCLQSPAVPCVLNLPGYDSIVNNLLVSSPLACGVSFATGSNTCQWSLAAHTNVGYPAINNIFNHNTWVLPDGASGVGPAPGFSATSSIADPVDYLHFGAGCTDWLLFDLWTYKNSITGYDFQGTCLNGGGQIAAKFTHFTGKNIVLTGSNAGISYASPGATNTFTPFARPANNAAVQYVNAANGDYHLASTSPFSAANGSATFIADDGTDLGANIDAINCATSGAATGTPPCDASLQRSIGSRKLVFRYTAPTLEVYTLSLYSAAAPTAGNFVAGLPDSDAASVSDGLRREIPITGLAAVSTHYWYRLANTSGSVAMVGDFWTRAVGSGTLNWPFGYPSATAVQYGLDKACTISCVTLGASTQPLVPVPSNTLIYAAPVANPNAVTILVTP
jgi:hypothetical protein